MAKISISEISEKELTNLELKKYYDKSKKEISSQGGEYPNFDFTDLDYIFYVACQNRGLFPNINMEKESKPEKYIRRWVLTYCSGINNLASKKKAMPKTACSDPLIKEMVKQAKKIEDDNMLDNQEKNHILFMSAENVLGNLLEEYIVKNIRSYGWIWCAGKTLRAIDFCNTKGTELLQVKNKSNSENSSSKNVREGTKIKKWYRLGTSKKGGKPQPSYKWDKLNDIINTYGTEEITEKCNMDEVKFQKYIRQVVEKNPEIITEK